MSRIRAASRLDVGEKPIITEGGRPLFQAAWMDIFGNCGPVIHLAADEALMNIFNPLEHYSVTTRVAHAWAHRHVDAVLGVSPRLVSEARVFGTDVTKLIHPFPSQKKWDNLGKISPELDSQQVLAVGSHRKKNNFEILQEIADEADSEIEFVVVGPDTELLTETRSVTTCGFVDESEFFDLYKESGAFILPAIAQPFPVSTLEALRAGLPPFVTTETGTSDYIHKVHPKLVSGVSIPQIAASLDWYFDLERNERENLSTDVRSIGDRFSPVQGKETFKIAYQQTMEELRI
ncbi:glycosyltransferase [Halonotius terrestris]|nr:glycosyltransferase [Halonotius terrestris]